MDLQQQADGSTDVMFETAAELELLEDACEARMVDVLPDVIDSRIPPLSWMSEVAIRVRRAWPPNRLAVSVCAQIETVLLTHESTRDDARLRLVGREADFAVDAIQLYRGTQLMAEMMPRD
jgi:hypothetical protein